MSCGNCERPSHSHRHSHTAIFGVGLVLMLGVALPAYLHIGLGWSPFVLAPAAFILLHILIVGAIAAFGIHIARSGHSSSAHSGALITRAGSYDRLVRLLSFGGEPRMRRRFVELAEIAPGHAVLDIGCGTGTLLLAAAEKVGATGRLVGVEPSAPMLERARAKAHEQKVNIEFIQAGGQHLSFENAKFDAVLCTMVIHHLPEGDRAALLAEAVRVLKPGSRLFIADVTAPDSLRSLFSIVSLAHLHAPHSLLSLHKLREMVERVGLTVVSEHRIGISISAIVCIHKS